MTDPAASIAAEQKAVHAAPHGLLHGEDPDAMLRFLRECRDQAGREFAPTEVAAISMLARIGGIDAARRALLG